ncbi:MAG: DUF1972 domain-containing protein [Crocinitomicaceae bacterium]|nr:DUF1972 domain-containing protein [Crocinitomicaceae bacterium]
MKKLAIIGSVGIPSKYGGFETLTEQLVNNLEDDYSIRVYCSKNHYSKEERVKSYKHAKLTYIPLPGNGIWSIPYDILSILHALFFCDTLLILGVSSGPIFPFLRLLTRKRIIVNIDGLEWKRDKWGKIARLYLKFSEYMAVKFSHSDITDNEEIKQYTALKYGTLSSLIEYGADHICYQPISNKYSIKYPFLYYPYAIKVARIVPENKIEMILEAFKSSHIPIVLIGNWKHSEYARKIKVQYSNQPKIKLIDAIYDQEELDVLRSNAELYVHGHSAGGTNPSLVEAMFLELPVFSFDCSFNRSTTENKAVYFKSIEELNALLSTQTMICLKQNREAMKEIAERRYKWKIICSKYIEVFEQRITKRQVYRDHNLSSKVRLHKDGRPHLINPIKYYQNHD